MISFAAVFTVFEDSDEIHSVTAYVTIALFEFHFTRTNEPRRGSLARRHFSNS